MIPFTDYSRIKNVDPSTVYRWIKAGKIVPVGNSIYDPELEKLSDKSKEIIIKEKKREFESLILKAHYNDSLTVPTVQQITEEVKHFQSLGMDIIGYAERSIYRKIKNPSQLKRKVRIDAGNIQNESLLKCYDLFIGLASKFYLANAKKSINYTIDLCIHFAKKNEDYYDIAAIPKPTLYRTFRNYISSHSMDEVNDFINHHNIWDQQKARVTGAFTDDINFMDYFIGDDHKFDIYKVLEFSPLRNKFEDKTLWSYFIIEAKTQKVLSYMVKTSEILSDDVIMLMMQALQIAGKPKCGILIDNGRINQSEDVKSFARKITLDINYSKPYQPTEKSPGERIFGYIKNEHDVFFNNFTGSQHATEGKHSGLSMTPAKPDYTLEEFVSSLDNYINDFYQNRPRTRKINGKNTTISIKEYFEKSWLSWEPALVDAQELRYAYMKEFPTVKEFRNELTFKGETYTPHDQYLPMCFNGKKYKIAHNPNDLTQIDLYATRRFVNPESGELINPDDFVITLYRTRSLANKQESIIKQNKIHKKRIREVAESFIDNAAGSSAELLDMVNSQVTDNGKIKHTRKAIVKSVMNEIGSVVPEARVKEIIKHHAEQDSTQIVLDAEIDYENDPLFNENI